MTHFDKGYLIWVRSLDLWDPKLPRHKKIERQVKALLVFRAEHSGPDRGVAKISRAEIVRSLDPIPITLSGVKKIISKLKQEGFITSVPGGYKLSSYDLYHSPKHYKKDSFLRDPKNNPYQGVMEVEGPHKSLSNNELQRVRGLFKISGASQVADTQGVVEGEGPPNIINSIKNTNLLKAGAEVKKSLFPGDSETRGETPGSCNNDTMDKLRKVERIFKEVYSEDWQSRTFDLPTMWSAWLEEYREYYERNPYPGGNQYYQDILRDKVRRFIRIYEAENGGSGLKGSILKIYHENNQETTQLDREAVKLYLDQGGDKDEAKKMAQLFLNKSLPLPPLFLLLSAVLNGKVVKDAEGVNRMAIPRGGYLGRGKDHLEVASEWPEM